MHGEGLSTFFGQSSFGTYTVVNERNVVKVDKDVDLALRPLGQKRKLIRTTCCCLIKP